MSVFVAHGSPLFVQTWKYFAKKKKKSDIKAYPGFCPLFLCSCKKNKQVTLQTVYFFVNKNH